MEVDEGVKRKGKKAIQWAETNSSGYVGSKRKQRNGAKCGGEVKYGRHQITFVCS